MRKISAIVTTKNEEDYIDACLESLSWVNEILVVDSFSEDKTIDIARKYTDFVVQHEYSGPADQKNWAISQVSNKWIILLDADEIVPPSLKEELQQWLKKDTIPFDAFWIPRQNHFMGKMINYSGWQGDKVVRFFRNSCRYNDKQVHEEIITEGIRVSMLKNKLVHYTFKNTSHYLDKMRRYAIWSAMDHLEKTPKITIFHLVVKPIFRFFKHFFFQGGILDGRHGLIVSAIMAWGVFLRYVYLLEKRLQG